MLEKALSGPSDGQRRTTTKMDLVGGGSFSNLIFSRNSQTPGYDDGLEGDKQMGPLDIEEPREARTARGAGGLSVSDTRPSCISKCSLCCGSSLMALARVATLRCLLYLHCRSYRITLPRTGHSTDAV